MSMLHKSINNDEAISLILVVESYKTKQRFTQPNSIYSTPLSLNRAAIVLTFMIFEPCFCIVFNLLCKLTLKIFLFSLKISCKNQKTGKAQFLVNYLYIYMYLINHVYKSIFSLLKLHVKNQKKAYN